MQQREVLTDIENIAQRALEDKTELAVRAVDSLLFQGPIMRMIEPMAGMLGMPTLSIGHILPQKKGHNLRRFLRCVNRITSLVLDDQVRLPEFVPILGETIREVQRISSEEK